jgi:hypothetical protein
MCQYFSGHKFLFGFRSIQDLIAIRQNGSFPIKKASVYSKIAFLVSSQVKF